MESLHCFKFFLQKNNFLCKINLKDANFSVRLYKESKKYIRYIWLGNLYEFLCLCFDVGPAPKILTKLKQILIALVRSLNVQLIIFLENILFRKLVRENYDVERHIDFYMAELVG